MKIAFNWLKEYVNITESPEALSLMLTNCGLEVESLEKVESIKGGLNGLVVGKVITKEKHPDADKLSVTTVDIGASELLHIVCGAPNVAAGQKVVVATVGAKLYPLTGEPFEIKKSKIRGAVSEGMLCAEDEIGLGESHAGIIVLNDDAAIGQPIKNYYNLQEEYVFEIGLTPNRSDAASHIGVARDIVAIVNANNYKDDTKQIALQMPSVQAFQENEASAEISVEIENTLDCPRYSGLTLNNITVKDSPEWLQNRLRAIGVRPINNVVDATNYVLHETGQPLHAFDAAKIKGKKVIVKKAVANSKFVTLDEQVRELSNEDLMICNAEEPMCIAGVFGGKESGVTNATTSLFIESAYFNSTTVRKSSKRHNLKTDASFRFERGTDPNITVYALKRVTLLLQEIAGATIDSAIIDIYPDAIKSHKVPFSYVNCNKLIGKKIDHLLIKNILGSLDIAIDNESNDSLLLEIPQYKTDVTREQDVIEEILRIYGYNNVEIPLTLKSSLSFSSGIDKGKIQNTVSDLLVNNGFSEMMNLSLSKEDLYTKSNMGNTEQLVAVMNPLSSDLNVMRQTLLFSALEALAYNSNRKLNDLKLFEFGKTYRAIKSESEATKYVEQYELAIAITGKKAEENWNIKNEQVNFYTLKGIVDVLFSKLGVITKSKESSNNQFAYALEYVANKRTVAEFGSVAKTILKLSDIKSEVFYAVVYWDTVIDLLSKQKTITYTEVPKFPEVRRDLALLIDSKISFDELKEIAVQTERKLLKQVNLFDVYQGDKLPEGKKSYALSFTLQDNEATLTDTQIEKVMEKLIKTYKEKAGAEIR
jgi:phenylalanyl-tRNA synthetase beta chain